MLRKEDSPHLSSYFPFLICYELLDLIAHETNLSVLTLTTFLLKIQSFPLKLKVFSFS